MGQHMLRPVNKITLKKIYGRKGGSTNLMITQSRCCVRRPALVMYEKSGKRLYYKAVILL